jgi:hypothetical protein
VPLVGAPPSYQTALSFSDSLLRFPAAELLDANIPVVDIFASVPAEAVAGKVYSKADSHVTPVRQVYPSMPAEPPTMLRRQDRTVIEMVIATDGLVERVRLRTPPRDIHEFMLLSAAKSWRFEPATIDGQPVRFLHSLAITTPQ